MEGFFYFLLVVVGIVWSVLGIILFFKIWKMTENVKTLTDYIVPAQQQNKAQSAEPKNEQKGDEDVAKSIIYNLSEEQNAVFEELKSTLADGQVIIYCKSNNSIVSIDGGEWERKWSGNPNYELLYYIE